MRLQGDGAQERIVPFPTHWKQNQLLNATSDTGFVPIKCADVDQVIRWVCRLWYLARGEGRLRFPDRGNAVVEPIHPKAMPVFLTTD